MLNGKTLYYKLFDNMTICTYNEMKVALGKIYSVGEKEMARTKNISLFEGVKGDLIKISNLRRNNEKKVA